MNKYCVYAHINSFTLEVFYIGIGCGFRPRRKSGRSEFWNRIVKKYGYIIKILHENLLWEEAVELEKMYIKKYGRINNKTGILANMTDGGDGAIGLIQTKRSVLTEDGRRRISLAHKGKKVSPETIAKRIKSVRENGKPDKRKGVPLTKEKAEFLRTVNIGRKHTLETRMKVSEKLKGRIFSEETKKKNSLALTGRVLSEEHRKNISQASKNAWNKRKANI